MLVSSYLVIVCSLVLQLQWPDRAGRVFFQCSGYNPNCCVVYSTGAVLSFCVLVCSYQRAPGVYVLVFVGSLWSRLLDINCVPDEVRCVLWLYSCTNAAGWSPAPKIAKMCINALFIYRYVEVMPSIIDHRWQSLLLLTISFIMHNII